MNLKNFFLIMTFCLGRMTMAERQELKLQAHKADEEIYFLQFDEVEKALAAQRTTLLFLGAAWCHNTQRFTPKYLQVQKWVESEKLYEKGFRMAKIECAVDREKFCVEEFKVDGFPTVLVYVDGKLLHEYPYADESDPVYHYIKKLIADYPPDPTKVYPEWGNGERGKPGEKVHTDSHSEEAIKILNDEHDALEKLNSDGTTVRMEDYNDNQISSLYPLMAGFALVSVAGFILYKWRMNSQYAKVSSHLSD